MSQTLTDEQCIEIIKTLARKLDVSPKLITTRLLSDLDKDDMRLGLLPIDSLECHIEAFRDNGFPDYAHGSTNAMRIENSFVPK
jgi:hypothetical protein